MSDSSSSYTSSSSEDSGNGVILKKSAVESNTTNNNMLIEDQSSTSSRPSRMSSSASSSSSSSKSSYTTKNDDDLRSSRKSDPSYSSRSSSSDANSDPISHGSSESSGSNNSKSSQESASSRQHQSYTTTSDSGKSSKSSRSSSVTSSSSSSSKSSHSTFSGSESRPNKNQSQSGQHGEESSEQLRLNSSASSNGVQKLADDGDSKSPQPEHMTILQRIEARRRALQESSTKVENDSLQKPVGGLTTNNGLENNFTEDQKTLSSSATSSHSKSSCVSGGSQNSRSPEVSSSSHDLSDRDVSGRSSYAESKSSKSQASKLSSNGNSVRFSEASSRNSSSAGRKSTNKIKGDKNTSSSFATSNHSKSSHVSDGSQTSRNSEVAPPSQDMSESDASGRQSYVESKSSKSQSSKLSSNGNSVRVSEASSKGVSSNYDSSKTRSHSRSERYDEERTSQSASTSNHMAGSQMDNNQTNLNMIKPELQMNQRASQRSLLESQPQSSFNKSNKNVPNCIPTPQNASDRSRSQSPSVPQPPRSQSPTPSSGTNLSATPEKEKDHSIGFEASPNKDTIKSSASRQSLLRTPAVSQAEPAALSKNELHKSPVSIPLRMHENSQRTSPKTMVKQKEGNKDLKKMTVLQVLEARRRALQQSSATMVKASPEKELSNQESQKKPDETLMHNQDFKIIEGDTNDVDSSSKTNYDPRHDEKEEWKALMKRSALVQGPSNEREEKEKGWMPPGLTSSRDKKLTLIQEGHNQRASNRQFAVMPITEIKVLPPAEDESTLGSMGHLFPKQQNRAVDNTMDFEGWTPLPSSKKQDTQLVSHRMTPTVAGIDYDQYRAWILPGVKPPSGPRPTVLAESTRLDPPGGELAHLTSRRQVQNDSLKPDVSNAIQQNAVDTTVLEAETLEENVPATTWAPSRPIYDAALSPGPTDEWERWKLERIMEQDSISDNSTTRRSIFSDWGPPRQMKSNGNREARREQRSDSERSTWIPPARLSRMDFSGSISSHLSPTGKERQVYKDPKEAESTKQTNILEPEELIIEAQRPGTPSISSKSSSSSEASHHTSSIAKSGPSSQVISSVSEQRLIIGNPDIEEGIFTSKRTIHSKASQTGCPRPVVVLCIVLGILALLGAVAAAVLIFTDRAGDIIPSPSKNENTPPTQPPQVQPVLPPTMPIASPTLPPFLAPTNPSPTLSPVDYIGDSLYDLIAIRYPDGAEALADANSPQSKAFQWLRSPLNSRVTSTLKQLQRYTLATLYFATDGENWSSSMRWLSEVDECEWENTASSGTMCDSFGNLIDLSLKTNNLQGNLPGELILLWNSIRTIDLQGNRLSGSIPKSIFNLNQLENIILADNVLSGTIASEIGDLNALQRIELTNNNIFSTIPAELGSLDNLTLLNLGSNQLTGTIPSSFGNMQNLAGLSLFQNRLSGTIPREISNIDTLQLLYVDENNLVGPLFNGICELNLNEFWADCREIGCECCTTCCTNGGGCL